MNYINYYKSYVTLYKSAIATFAILTSNTKFKKMRDKKPSKIFISTDSSGNNNWSYDDADYYCLPFSSALAYNAKNPLTCISLSVGLLESTIIDSNQQHYLSLIKKNYLRINNLMGLLLLQQPNNEMRLKECSIQKFIDETIESLNERISLENISVSKEYDEKDFIVMMNEPKMKVALTNILINAMDALPIKEGSLKLSTKIADGKYTIEVKDNGCGIKKERLKYIFLPYFSEKQNGAGMGLALTYDILRANDVGVNILSTEDEGTCFILSFNNLANSQPVVF